MFSLQQTKILQRNVILIQNDCSHYNCTLLQWINKVLPNKLLGHTTPLHTHTHTDQISKGFYTWSFIVIAINGCFVSHAGS